METLEIWIFKPRRDGIVVWENTVLSVVPVHLILVWRVRKERGTLRKILFFLNFFVIMFKILLTNLNRKCETLFFWRNYTRNLFISSVIFTQIWSEVFSKQMSPQLQVNWFKKKRLVTVKKGEDREEHVEKYKRTAWKGTGSFEKWKFELFALRSTGLSKYQCILNFLKREKEQIPCKISIKQSQWFLEKNAVSKKRYEAKCF